MKCEDLAFAAALELLDCEGSGSCRWIPRTGGGPRLVPPLPPILGRNSEFDL
jgi:hypothetical protein